MPYLDVPRSDSAVAADLQLELVRQWLRTLKQPKGQTDSEYKTFMRYCTEFFLGEDDRLWRKDTKGAHKIVIPQEHCIFLLTSAHNNVGHHGFYVQMHYWQSDTGGQLWVKTSLGSFPLATSVSLEKHNRSLFRLPLLLRLHSLLKPI